MSEAAVPIREGEYGERVAAVEPGGIEVIPDDERHGHPRSLFWTWFSPNMEFATVYIGVLPVVVFGGGFLLTSIALCIGTAIGSATHAVMSTMGPRHGIPQLVQSRRSFGWWGNRLPALLNTITAGPGWVAVNSVSGAFALMTFCGVVGIPVPAFAVALGIIVAIEIVAAFMGHNLIHALERLVFPFLTIVFALCVVWIFGASHPSTGFNGGAPAATGGVVGAFLISVFFGFSYAVSWNPYASDYSRYLHSETSPRRTALAAGLGIFVSCTLLEVAGVALATVAGTHWGTSDVPTDQFIVPLPHALAILAPLAICIGAVAANILNLYSGAMSFLTLGIQGGLRHRRAIAAVGIGTLGFLIALTGAANPGGSYESFLFLSTYWIVPFVAVVLTDLAVNRAPTPTALFFSHRHRNLPGVIAFLVGVAAEVPFMNQTVFTGWLAAAIPQTGDISWVAGALVASAVYALLHRRRAGALPAHDLAGRAQAEAVREASA